MLLAAIDPSYNANQAELKRLRGNSAEALRKNQWYRMVQNGVTTGFSHVCACAHEVKIASPLDMFKTYRCNCGERFALFDGAGVPKRCPHDEIAFYLMRLPARVSAGTQQRNQTPQVGTWNADGETVEWVGAPQ